MSIERIREETEALGEGGIDWINEELVAEYQQQFPEGPAGDVEARDESGQSAAAPEVEGEAVEATRVYYGNRYVRIGSCFYWTTNGVGQPCGWGFRVRACNWRSVSVTRIASCAGGYAGYRFVFTY